MRTLGAPLRGDPRVISGESGAAGCGLLASILQDESLADFKTALGLNAESVILLFSTEGDTDPGKYLDIVWKGEYS
jgi:diaminopropionate ammonia-lyase